MKEIPILFSTPMVTAIMEGRKTQTRRMTGLDEVNLNPGEWKLAAIDDVYIDGRIQGYGALLQGIKNPKAVEFVRCPYGEPNDRLWVRETWQWEGDTKWSDARPMGSFWYKADGHGSSGPSRYKPSIHMPKAAARIWLEVEGVRVEKLQDISEEDAIAEGVEYHSKEYGYAAYGECAGMGPMNLDAVGSYHSLWDSINGANAWEQNPFVWVIKFKRIEA